MPVARVSPIGKSRCCASRTRFLKGYQPEIRMTVTIANPKIFYLKGEHMCGSQLGAGLGYIIFDGNNNSHPRKLDERVYGRIDELKQKFLTEVEAKGLSVPQNQVGVHALNVYDT